MPLSKEDLYSLVNQYAENLALEIKNELSSFYDAIQIETIFNALSDISKVKDCSYQRAVSIITEHTTDIPIEPLLEDLFNRSIIGNKKANGHFILKCREPLNSAEIYKIKPENHIIIQNGFNQYFSRKY